MKKLTYLFVVIVFAFGMTACAQETASVDNKDLVASVDNTISKYSSNSNAISDENLSPEVKKLKAEFLKEIKQQYFIDRGLKVPSSLKIILMSNVYGTIYTYFAFDGKMSGARKTTYGKISAPGGFIKTIHARHKKSEDIIYQE